MIVPYKCCVKEFEDFYLNQAGNGISFYQGQPHQKGYGIGGWFKKIFRSALPFITRGAKTVGKEVLRTGTQIANDVLEGRNVQESTEMRVKETGKTLAKKALKTADGMLGQGKKYKRKRKLPKRFISPKVEKVKRRDIFDL